MRFEKFLEIKMSRPFRSRRDREAMKDLEEQGLMEQVKLENIELGPDGKPCRACTSVKDTLDSLKQGLDETKRQDCAPDVNQIGNNSWVSCSVQIIL